MERFGSFCIGMTALVAVGILAAGVGAHPAAAARGNPGLEKLWEQFPLDPERDAPAERQRSSDGPGAKADPAPPARRMTRKAVPQGGGADSTFGTSALLTIVAAGIALLLGGFAVLYTGHVPRPPRVRMPARPFVRGRRLAQAAAVAATDGVRRARATLPTPRSPAIPAADPSLTARRVVDDLLQVVSAAPPRRKPEEAKMLRTTHRAGHAPEIEALKTKPRVADALKHLKAGPQAEAEVLKRKPPADRTDMLKAKRESEGMLDKQRLAPSDDVALKEKLAATREQKHVAKPRQDPARARQRKGRAKRESALRPVPDLDAVEARNAARDARASAERPQECEVQWWRGYVRSQFLAVSTRTDEAGVTIAESPSFRWRKSEPPPETLAAAAALRRLVESLEREGWKVVGRGEEWFAVRLAGARRVDRAGRADVSQSGT